MADTKTKRMFDGKEFTLVTWLKSKADAEDAVRYYRSVGYRARAVRRKDGWWYIYVNRSKGGKR